MASGQRPVEIEIKLRLPPAAADALQAHPVLSRAEPAEQRHHLTTYFDTPALELAAAGVSLRIRRTGERRVQTVKAADGHAVAPQRGEWEQPVAGDEPDLAAAAATPAGEVLRRLDGVALRPVFTTDIHRVTRIVRLDNKTIVEAAFDHGTITAETRSEPVSELELELKGGDPGALYRLAIELAAAAPLAIEPASKAERGLRLSSGAAPTAVKAADLDFGKELHAAAAFSTIIRSVLSHMLANLPPARLGDAEGIHQLRIAVRRMRAALRLFKPVLRNEAAARFGAELRRAGQVFGEARDWDVFVLESMPKAATQEPEPGWLDLLREPAGLRRHAAHARLRQELDAPAFTALMLGLAGWIEDGADEPALLGDDQLRRPIAALAPDLIRRLARTVAKRGRGVDQLPREALHELRKSVKKLRYGIEFLAPLYPRKPVKAAVGACKDLQELLGDVNDAAVTPALAEQLTEDRPELAPAMGELAAWAGNRGKRAHNRVPKAWRKLRAADGFWT